MVKDRHNALVYARIKFGSHSSAVGNDSPLDLWGKDWSSTEVTTRPTRAQRCVHPPGKEPMPSELASGVRLPMFSTKKKLLPAPHHQQLYYLTLGRAEQEIEILLARGFIYVHVHH